MIGVDVAESLARSVGGLAVVLGLIWIAVRLLRRRMAMPSQSQLRVVQRVGLGKKSGVAVIEVGERCILVGIGESSITFLSEVESEPGSVTDLRPANTTGPAETSVPPAVPLQRPVPPGLRGVMARAQDRTVRR